MKSGKRFEQNFKASVPKDVFCERLKDGTASWGDKETTRFQATNICDFILADGEYVVLAELKNHKGKSLPLSCIRKNQFDKLLEADRFVFIKPMLIVNFEDVDKCYALNIDLLDDFIKEGKRKSIPISYFEEWAIEIPSRKKKVNTEYRLDVLFGVYNEEWKCTS